MDTRSTYLLLIFFLCIIGSAALSYQRIMVVHGYDVVESQESIIDQLGF